MDICRENYIVRVYRRSKGSPYNIIGIIEDVEREANKAFHNAEELVNIIVGKDKDFMKETPMSHRLTKEDENNPPSPPFSKGGMGGLKAFSGENIEKSRNDRLRLMLPVKVRGVNIIGKRFSENAFIKDISSGGAYLYMKNQVSADASLHMMIDPDVSSLNIKARVVRIEKGENKTGVGVAFI